MNCPSEDSQLRALVGALTVHETESLARHRAECARCRALGEAHAQLLSDLRARPTLAHSDEAFVASVLLACEAEHPGARPPPARRPQAPLWGAGALVAAAALALVSGVLRPTPQRSAPSARERAQDVQSVAGTASESITARGAGDDHAPLAFADLLFVRAGVATRLSGAALVPGDEIAVRCTNRGSERVYLAVFALDASGTTHWIYPAYDDESVDASSIAIEPHLHDRLLDEVVEPAAPARGALRAYAVWSPTPLTVHAIEAHLDQLSASAPDSFFARAQIQRWSATWNVP